MGRLEKKETSKERRKEREQKKEREKREGKREGKDGTKKKNRKERTEKYFSLSFLHTDLSQFDGHLTHMSVMRMFSAG